MNVRVRAAMTALLLLTPTVALAQLDLPAKSPKAMVMQRIGLTDVTVEYSSPAVGGRTVYGELVPFGELWRTGANAATRITFSRDVTVGGKAVAAGTYALYTIPKKDGAWTVIVNRGADNAGTRGYKESDDVARVEVAPVKAPKRERMTFLFEDTTVDGASLTLWWDELRLPIPITTATRQLVTADVTDFQVKTGRALASAARTELEDYKNVDAALALIDKALALDGSWYAFWIKAMVMKQKGDTRGALMAAKKAWDLGQKAEFFYEKQVREALDTWK